MAVPVRPCVSVTSIRSEWLPPVIQRDVYPACSQNTVHIPTATGKRSVSKW